MEKVVIKLSSTHSYRYERKFQVRNLSLKEIELMIKLHPAGFHRQYSERYVNNIYLDTLNNDAALENIDGIAKRIKTRIRWYGDCFGDIYSPTLELKIKSGFVGRKEYFPLKPFIFDRNFTANYFSNYLNENKFPDNISLHLSPLSLNLLNNYTRQYYLSNNEKFRLTIDNNLNYYRLGHNNNNFKFLSSDKASIILGLPLIEWVDYCKGYER